MDLWSKWRSLEFSDPNNHNPNDYIYIVHAIQNGNNIRNLIKLREGSVEKQYDLIRHPRDVSKMGTISCSLIGKGRHNGIRFEQLETWAQIGLILKVPVENIVRCGKSDLEANFVDSNAEIKKHINDDKGDPWDLLLHGYGYNEVVVQGETEYGKVDVIGVFASDYSSKCYDADIANNMARRIGVPLVPIPRKQISLDDKPIEIVKRNGKLDRIEFVKNGRKFYCNLNRDVGGLTWGIYATGDYGAPFIRSKEDIEMFFRELENLDQKTKEEYADVLAVLPEQYDKCVKYFNREIDEDTIYDKNYILERHDDNKTIVSDALSSMLDEGNQYPDDNTNKKHISF